MIVATRCRSSLSNTAQSNALHASHGGLRGAFCCRSFLSPATLPTPTTTVLVQRFFPPHDNLPALPVVLYTSQFTSLLLPRRRCCSYTSFLVFKTSTTNPLNFQLLLNHNGNRTRARGYLSGRADRQRRRRRCAGCCLCVRALCAAAV